MHRTTLFTLLLLTPLLAAACDEAGDTAETAADGVAADTAGAATVEDDTATRGSMLVVDVGLSTPESVLHDPDADVYLVSNINGSPLEKDGNGFISRVATDGTMDSARWIDGAAGVPLHAPKGMALHGDTLFVTDIDSVRAFDRGSGEYLGGRGVDGATFLNDLAVGPDGALYVSDSGLNADFSSSGSDAIYRFEGEEPVPVVQGAELGSPNGLAIVDSTLYIAFMGSPTIRALELGGDRPERRTGMPAAQLDGIVALDDGSLLVSSWEGEAVYRVWTDETESRVETILQGIPSPADIGFDARRERILIPVFNENRVEIRPLP